MTDQAPTPRVIDATSTPIPSRVLDAFGVHHLAPGEHSAPARICDRCRAVVDARPFPAGVLTGAVLTLFADLLGRIQ